jgi:drug/metabolite transporter (DMT)-like permease
VSWGRLHPVEIMKLRHGQALALMVLVTLMWSIAGVVTRQLEQARSFEVTFWRSFFTVISLLVILPLWQGPSVWRRIQWRRGSLCLSGLCWAIMFTAFMLALTLTSVANVLVMMAVGPLLTALLARVFIGQRLPLRTWVAIFVAGAGIVWMYGAQMGQALCVPLAAAVQWTLVQRNQGQTEAVDLLPAVLLGAALSSVLTLPLSLPWVATRSDIAWLALLGLVQLAIPCLLAIFCARVLKAAEVSLLALLEVVFGITLAWWGAGEVPDARVLMGGSLVLAALVANESLAWRTRNV